MPSSRETLAEILRKGVANLAGIASAWVAAGSAWAATGAKSCDGRRSGLRRELWWGIVSLRRFLESATPARAVVGGEAGCGAGVDVGRGGRQSSSRQVSRTAVGRRGIFWAVLKP